MQHSIDQKRHVISLTFPQFLVVANATVSFSVAKAANADGTIDIQVRSDKVALWVVRPL